MWFTYNDAEEYEMPTGFNLASLFKIMIRPAILPVDFHRGRNRLQSYEFNYPSIEARQLVFDQLLIKLFLSIR